MSEPTATSQTATPQATATEPAEPARNADGTVDINEFVKMGQAELAKERAEAADAEKRATGEPTKDKAERGEDGKFKAKDKTEPAKKDDEPAPKPTGGSVNALRRMWGEGKVLEVLRTISGDESLESLDALHIPSKALAGLRHEARQAHRERAETQAAAQRIVQRYAPLEKAAQLRDSGDTKGALEAFFGKSLEDVQADVVASYHKTDPTTLQTRREIQQLREELRQEREQAKQLSQQQTLAQQQAKEREVLVEYLSGSDDARIARVAQKPAFQNMVVQKMREAYNPKTRIGIPWSEAAEQAYDDLYGDLLDASATPPPKRGATDRRHDTAETTDRRPETTVKRRNLDPKRSTESAEPSPPPPGTREAVEWFARQGEMERMRGEF